VVQEAFPEARLFLQQLQDELAGSTEPPAASAPAQEVLRRAGSSTRRR
jgi:hypothetical protein